MRAGILQNRASLPAVPSAIQKSTPSLQAPREPEPGGNGKVPSGLKSAAFQSDTTSPTPLVTRTRSPSNAAAKGRERPLPVSVARTAPVEARTTVTLETSSEGTQMFAPSKTACSGCCPTVTVWRIAPEESSLRSAERPYATPHTFEPSKTAPFIEEKPPESVVTVHGSEAPGVTIETDGLFIVQMRAPSKASPRGSSPRLVATAVMPTAAGCDGSMR